MAKRLRVKFSDTIGDATYVGELVREGSDVSRLEAAQAEAARKLLNFDGEKYPKDGCAITLSVLLQNAGIGVPDTFLAFDLSALLQQRGWQKIAIGDQQAGDVGCTCGVSPQHGFDHIYLVLSAVNHDEMVVADNHFPKPYFRWASGNGRVATLYFLRAS